MLKGGKEISNITTVGQLKDALVQFHPDTPITCDLKNCAKVIAWHDYDTNDLCQVEIDGCEEDE